MTLQQHFRYCRSFAKVPVDLERWARRKQIGVYAAAGAVIHIRPICEPQQVFQKQVGVISIMKPRPK